MNIDYIQVKMQNMKNMCHYCRCVIFDSCTGCTLKDCIAPLLLRSASYRFLIPFPVQACADF